ncbi:MAG: flagellar hook-length control protein FliK [Clostridium sp.]|uniref:flagellar hook-length control protein FliK n=1 Tax=Clostridium sp. TaxID=1506 RepID=UPI00304B3ACC
MVDIGQVVNVNIKNTISKSKSSVSKVDKDSNVQKSEFSKELQKVNKDNKIKDKNINENQDATPKDNKELDEDKVDEKESLKSLIDILISLMNTTKDGVKPNITEEELKTEISNLGNLDLKYLSELLGDGKVTDNLMGLLKEMSESVESKESFLNLMNSISNDEEFLENNSTLIKGLFEGTSEDENGDLISKLQQLVKLSQNKENQIVPKNDKVNNLDNTGKILNANNVNNEESQNNAEKNSNQDNTSKKDEFSKESQILSKVINGNEKESKVTRVADFMAVFENNILDIEGISNEKPLAMSKSNLNNDVIKALAYMDKNGIKDLTVKIYPKELGEVSISISMEQGTLKAMIKATSKEAVDMLSLGLKDINEKIGSTDIKIQSVDIGLYEDDTTYFAQQNRERDKSNENGAKNKNVEIDEDINVEGVIPETNINSRSEINLLV